MGLAVRLFRICGNATASAPFPSHRLVTKLYDCRSFRQCSKEGKYSCHRTLTGSWISWMSSCGFLKPDLMTKSTASRNTLIGIAAGKRDLRCFGHDAHPELALGMRSANNECPQARR